MSKNKAKNNNNGPETIVMILVGLPGKNERNIKDLIANIFCTFFSK